GTCAPAGRPPGVGPGPCPAPSLRQGGRGAAPLPCRGERPDGPRRTPAPLLGNPPPKRPPPASRGRPAGEGDDGRGAALRASDCEDSRFWLYKNTILHY